MSLSDFSSLERLGIYFLILIVMGSLLEIGLFIYGYINADKVKCNLLWCTFIKEESFSQCYVNDIKVNCNEMNMSIPNKVQEIEEKYGE